LGVAVVFIAGVVAFAPATQDPRYHDFADRFAWLGVPNGKNVLSNVPFVILGVWGMARARRTPAADAWVRGPMVILFATIALVGFSSGYYHLQPSDARLVWDRLPIAMTFLALLAIVIGLWTSPRAGRRLLVPFMVFGAGSVAVWARTGELRPYIVAQFLPMLMIPLIVGLVPVRRAARRDLAAGLGLYVLAKLFELEDARIYELGGVVSGHTLKHLAAATAVSFIARMLRRDATRG